MKGLVFKDLLLMKKMNKKVEGVKILVSMESKSF